MKILQSIHLQHNRPAPFSALCGAQNPKATTLDDLMVTCEVCLMEMRAQVVEKALDSDDTVRVYVQGK